MKRFGIYGGTFNPPHNGHASALKHFTNALSLDRVFVIPTGTPPHKSVRSNDDPYLRLKMTRAAFEDFSRGIIVSDYEVTKAGKSYTVDTLGHFWSEDSKLFLLCGTDMFLSFESWRDFRRIFELAAVVCMPREEELRSAIAEKAREYKTLYNAECVVLEGESVELSSTQVRNAVAEGRDMTALVPDAVERIIREERLYV